MHEKGEKGDPGERGKRGDQGSFGHQGNVGLQGPQGEPGHDAPIHPWRWRFLAVWILVFTAVVIFVLHKNSDTVNDLKKAKASVSQLEKTNCNTEKFLLTARLTRYQASRHEDDGKKQNDLAAANGYKVLAQQFVSGNGNCQISPHLFLPGDTPNDFG